LATDTGFGKVKVFHDFTGTAVDQTNDINVGLTSTGSIAISVQNNGACRLTTKAEAAATARISSGLQWNPSHGSCVMEARVTQQTAVTARAFFIGWTNDSTTDQTPISLATTVFTGTAENAVGFVFNTAASDGSSIYCVGSKESVCTAGVDTDVAVAAITVWQTFRVEVSTDGDAVFSINGKEEARIENAITADTDITPTVCATATAATAVVMDVDYIYAEGSRE